MTSIMSSFVNICKYEPNSSKTINKIALNNMKTKVKTLSQLVSKELELTEDQFDLMCFGRVLNEDKSLDSYEITNGTTVFVINKTNLINAKEKTTESQTESKAPKLKINQSDIQHMVIALKTALMDPSFRQMLDKLSEPEFKENLMAVTPGLREDPTTLAILQDPDLLSTLTEPTNIHKVLERHPCLLEAATFLSATFHEETIANDSRPSGSGLLSRSSSTFSYSLDAMSDDDDMDDSEATEANPNNSSTAQRIAEQMVRAYQLNQNSGNSSNQANSSGVITQDMLRQALRHSSSQSSIGEASTSAPATSSTQVTSAAATSTTASPSGPSVSARYRSWATQIQQLRDLGINDEIVALQALEATNGDVEAAINIIFSDHN